MNQEPTNADILKVITEGQKRTDGRIDKIDARFDKIDKHISDVLEVVNDFSTKMDKDVTAIKATLTTMPTRDDMNEALANTKADIIVTMRKEDVKLREVVSILSENKVLTPVQVQHIVSMEPFAQLSV